MERKLASIQRIREILPIENADFLETVIINSWKVVAKKGEWKVGDLCVYCEIDSFLPIREEFEFLRSSSYRKMGDVEGFRIRTIKLKKQISQGLTLPLSILEGDAVNNEIMISMEEGSDVTERLRVLKYEPPIPACLSGMVKGNFPSFIFKTDEERIQNLTSQYDKLKEYIYYVTEKIDGTSSTFYLNNDVFGVCSRNLDLKAPESGDGNTYWATAKKYAIEERLRAYNKNFAIQGEIIGLGIQGNIYKLNTQKLYVFNVFDIDNQEYLDLNEMEEFLSDLNMNAPKAEKLELVPLISDSYILPDTIDDLLIYANAKSLLCDKADREGIVIRNKDKSISFKAISNNYLLKNEN